MGFRLWYVPSRDGSSSNGHIYEPVVTKVKIKRTLVQPCLPLSLFFLGFCRYSALTFTFSFLFSMLNVATVFSNLSREGVDTFLTALLYYVFWSISECCLSASFNVIHVINRLCCYFFSCVVVIAVMSGKVEMTLKRKDVRKSRYIANVSPRAKDGYAHAKGQAKNRFFFLYLSRWWTMRWASVTMMVWSCSLLLPQAFLPCEPRLSILCENCPKSIHPRKVLRFLNHTSFYYVPAKLCYLHPLSLYPFFYMYLISKHVI